jgi:UDP-GlcNAc:undecaprenyl-phosphate/decaprenyl-phosphate GlcNAc-1-phosphate transferase
MNITNYIILFIAISSIATYILLKFSSLIATRCDLMDKPGGHKIHHSLTPLMGGVVMLVVILPLLLAASIIFLPAEQAQLLQLAVLATLPMTILGIIDDRRALPAGRRFMIQVFIFAALAWYNPLFQVRVLVLQAWPWQLGLGNEIFAIIFTSLCCVGLLNAINMADGLNGLTLGLFLYWFAVMAWHMHAPLALVPAIVLPSLLALLGYNLRGKIFMGDGGAYGFATLLALLTIALYNMSHINRVHNIGAELIVLLFIVPICDMFRLIVTRAIRRKSPLLADHNHLHHHLMQRFGKRYTVSCYWLLAALPSLIYISLGFYR